MTSTKPAPKIKTCRTIHECARCYGFIIYGQRYRDAGRGKHFHLRCPRDRAGVKPRSYDGGVKIGQRLEQIKLRAEDAPPGGFVNIFVHSNGLGRRYLLSVNEKAIPPDEIVTEYGEFNLRNEVRAGYGYTVQCLWPNFRYMGDAFGFTTPKKALAEAKQHFEAVKQLFKRHSEREARRRAARRGKLEFFPGVRE